MTQTATPPADGFTVSADGKWMTRRLTTGSVLRVPVVAPPPAGRRVPAEQTAVPEEAPDGRIKWVVKSGRGVCRRHPAGPALRGGTNEPGLPLLLPVAAGSAAVPPLTGPDGRVLAEPVGVVAGGIALANGRTLSTETLGKAIRGLMSRNASAKRQKAADTVVEVIARALAAVARRD